MEGDGFRVIDDVGLAEWIEQERAAVLDGGGAVLLLGVVDDDAVVGARLSSSPSLLFDDV